MIGSEYLPYNSQISSATDHITKNIGEKIPQELSQELRFIVYLEVRRSSFIRVDISKDIPLVLGHTPVHPEFPRRLAPPCAAPLLTAQHPSLANFDIERVPA